MWSREELQYSVKYPYSSNTKEIVRYLNFDISNIDPRVLERAKQRAQDGIEDGIVRPEHESHSRQILLTELLSYPVAKIIVSSTKDQFLIKKYSSAEAAALRKFLLHEKSDVIDGIALDLGLSFENNSVYFVDYVNHIPSKDECKLINSMLSGGKVELDMETKVELASSALKARLEKDLSQKYDVPSIYTTYGSELKKEVNREKAFSPRDQDYGEVEAGLFPPCIKELVEAVQSGQPMAHQPRFVLSTYLTNIGMPIDQMVELFRNTPNFNEKKTRYYIQYSSGKRGSGVKYTPPACAKMETYGLCVGKDALCQRIKHPLSYYSAKKRFKGERKDAKP